MAKITTAKKKKIKLPEKYTAASMVQYMSEKYELPKNQTKEIINGFLELVASGVLKGERVPLGTIGKLYANIRPARKARKGRNPLTGEEITIAAKRATKVPKISFSKAYKEQILKAKVKKK